MGFRPDINGLRAIAVICVVLYHFNVPGFRGGFVGVDVFFVISGFLMTHAVMSKLTAGSFSVLDFYVARARRIVPALAAVCLVLLLASAVLLLPLEYVALARQSLSAVTFVSNIVFWRERGYFDAPSQEKFLLHTWSLSVEWQFYLLFPLLVLVLFRWFGRRGVVAGLGVAAVVSFGLNLVLTRFKPEAGFFLFPPRAWELLAGGFVYLSGDRLKAALLAPLGLAAIAASTFLFDDALAFPGAWALLPVGGAAAIVAAQGSARWLTNRPMQFLGDTSYSLYLVHWPLVVWLRHYQVALEPLAITRGIADAEAVGLTAAALGLSYLSYRFVETPFRKLGSKQAPARALAQHLLPAFGVAAASAGVWVLGGLPSRVPPLVAKNDAATVDSGDPEHCPTRNGVCHLGPDQPRKVLFWGDSHMEHLYGALVALEPKAEASGRQILMAVSHRCIPVRGFDNGNRTDCDQKFERVWRVAQDPSVETVVIGSIWTPYFRERLYDLGSKPTICVVEGTHCRRLDTAEEALGIVATRLEADVKTLVAQGKHVTIVLPVPAYPLPMARILALRLWRNEPVAISLPRAKHVEAQRIATDVLRAVAARAGAKVIDPTDVFCPGESCVFSLDGVSIYRDTNHLTAAGARLLAPALSAVLGPEEHAGPG